MRYPSWSDYATGEHSEAPYLHDSLWAAWMPMFGATGSTLFDVGPYAFHADANNRTNATDWTTQRFSAAYFQEANASGRFIPPARSSLASQLEATISCWVWLVATPATTAAIYQDTATALTGARFGLLWTSGGSIQFQMRDPYTQRSIAPLTTATTTDTYGRWSHWCATYSASAATIVLYRDGVAVRTSANSGDQIRGTSVYGIGIGGRINSSAAEASNDLYLAELRLWNRSLNSEEVRELGSAPGAGFRRRNVLSRVAIAFTSAPQTVTVPVADLTASAVLPTYHITTPVPVADLTAAAVLPTYHLTVPVPVASAAATAILPTASATYVVTVPVAEAAATAILPVASATYTVTKEVIVEKQIEVPVEVIIEKPVIQYVEVEKEIIKEIPVDRVVEKIVEVTKEIPVEKVVIKEVIKEIPIEKVVEKEVFITDDKQVNELLLKIQQLESDKQIFSTKTQELEEEVRKFSTITTENENIFHYKMSKKDEELDELRHSLDILRQTPPVEKIVEVVVEKPVDDSKSQKLQETLAKLRQDILDKDKKISDLELKISELMGLQQEKKALYLKGSNLDDKLYK